MLVALMAGTVILVLGLALGVPLAPLAAAWITMTNLIPQIGGALGGIPFVLLGLTQGVGTGLACAAGFLIYQQCENNLIGPVVIGKVVKLSPPVTMAAALIGVSAGGVVGALIAVPIVGAVKTFYMELRSEVTAGPPEPAPEPAPP
jgi:predicted PurR-regulated permease PerM